MTHDSIIVHPEFIVMIGFAGLIFGLLYFAALKRNVALFIGGKGWIGPLMLTLGRIGAAVAFLFVAAKLGAVALLAAFIGFLTARALALRANRRTV